MLDRMNIGLLFAIGGPHGHAPAVRQQAHKTLALSKMVLNHELARILLVEQLYRASTLLWGGAYHHATEDLAGYG